MIKTVGSSSDPGEIERLYHQGIELIPKLIGQASIDFAHHADRTFVKTLENSIQSHRLVGPNYYLVIFLTR
mgnify:CR=1 FL=1